MLVEPRISFSADDFQMGGRLGGGTTWGGVPVALFAEFEARPYGRTTGVPVTQNLSYQLREHRYFIGPGTAVHYPLASWLQAAAGAGFGYTFGNFRGSDRSPESGWTGWVETGLRVVYENTVWLETGYQWRPLPGISPHRVTTGLGVRLTW